MPCMDISSPLRGSAMVEFRLADCIQKFSGIVKMVTPENRTDLEEEILANRQPGLEKK